MADDLRQHRGQSTDERTSSHRQSNAKKARRHPGPSQLGGRAGRSTGRSTGRTGDNTRPDECLLFGLHAAEFALRNQDRGILSIWATENAERKLAEAIALRGLNVERVTPRDLDKRLGPDTVHQGIALEVQSLATAELAHLAEQAIETKLPIVILDQVTDPHNVGAVLRSAAVFGAVGVIMTHRHSPPLGGTLAKSASGALDLMPVCLVQNLASAINTLKQQSVHIVGFDGGHEHPFVEDVLGDHRDQALALVLGAEGKGLREMTRSLCQEICRIGGDGPIESLNVSNAAAIALHTASTLRR